MTMYSQALEVIDVMSLLTYPLSMRRGEKKTGGFVCIDDYGGETRRKIFRR